MAEPVVIGSFPKSRREDCRVALTEWRETRLIDIRLCVELCAAVKTQTPTAKGVSLNVALLPELRRLLAEAEDKAREIGWLQ
jgi:hypothetical protein